MPDGIAGVTRFGGLPDLAPDFQHPIRTAYTYDRDSKSRHNDSVWISKPLSFLAQFNLEDLTKIGTDLPLPDKGILQFFYDVENQPWGFDPKDQPGFLVRWIEDTSKIVCAQQNDQRSYSVELQPGDCLPGYEWVRNKLISDGSYSIEELDKNFNLLDAGDLLYDLSDIGHCIGGWPDIIQNPMELECQLASNGLYLGSEDGYRSEKAEQLKSGADDWRLLLQLESCEDILNWIWGDVGTLYFWCREQDIAAKRFDRVWTVLQCF